MPIQNQTSETVTYNIDNGGGESGDLTPDESEHNTSLTPQSLVEFYSVTPPINKLASTRLPAIHDDPNGSSPTTQNTMVWLMEEGGGYMAGWRFIS
jgi:hypothetical protein